MLVLDTRIVQVRVHWTATFIYIALLYTLRVQGLSAILQSIFALF